MSNTTPKCIALIVRRVYSGDLLDRPLFATKPPFHPKSSRCSFSKYLYTRHFPKHALLDLPRRLKPRGKVHRNRGKSRHFPRRWRRQVRRERPVEPVPQQATGESASESREIPALSPEVETAGAAREACGAGAPASCGGKCTKIAEIPGTFPGGGDGRCGERGLWSRCPSKPRGKVHQNRGKSRHFPRRWRRQVRRERPVEPVPQQAAGESAPKSQKFPALSPEGDTCS